jgi:hypothetical protein
MASTGHEDYERYFVQTKTTKTICGTYFAEDRIRSRDWEGVSPTNRKDYGRHFGRGRMIFGSY